jgi:hypothetical protein
MECPRRTRLPYSSFSNEAHAVCRNRQLANQLAHPQDVRAVARDLGKAMAIAQLMPEAIVVRQQSAPLGGRK